MNKLFFQIGIFILLLLYTTLALGQHYIEDVSHSSGEYRYIYNDSIISPNDTLKSVTFYNTSQVTYKAPYIQLRKGFGSYGYNSGGFFKAYFPFRVYADAQKNCEQDSGVINLEVFGGRAPFSYQWSTGSTTDTIHYNGIGSYYVTVTDSRGKTTTATCFVNSEYRSEIAWTDLVGAVLNGDTIRKNMETLWGNSGAASKNKLQSNIDGFIEYRASINSHEDNMTNERCLGFSEINTGSSYNTIDYALYFKNDTVFVYEAGVPKTNGRKYFPFDKFVIQRTGNTMIYLLNSDTLYLNNNAGNSDKDLIVDLALYNHSSYFENIRVSFCEHENPLQLTVTSQMSSHDSEGSAYANVIGGTQPYTFTWESTYFGTPRDSIIDTTSGGYLGHLLPGFYNVEVEDKNNVKTNATFRISEEIIWKYSSGVVFNNNTIEKTGESGWSTGVLNSANRLISEEDGMLEIEIIDLSTEFNFGFKDTMLLNNDGLEGLSYGLLIQNGQIHASEDGVVTSNISTCNTGDILSIQRRGSDIYYLKNDTVIRTATISAFARKPVNVHIGINNIGGLVAVPIYIPMHPIPFFPIFSINVSVMNCIRFDPPNGYISVSRLGGAFYNSYNYEFVLIDDGTETVVQSSSSNAANLSQPGIYEIRITANPLFGTTSLNRVYKRFVGVYPDYSNDVGTLLAYYPIYNIIKKTGASGSSQSGFSSYGKNELDHYQNGWVGYNVQQLGVQKAIGLSEAPNSVVNGIDYAYIINGNSLEIRENGIVTYVGGVSVNDRLQISRHGYSIKYWQNENLLREVATDPSLTLMVDGVLYTTGAYYEDVFSSFCFNKCVYEAAQDLSASSELVYTTCANVPVSLNIDLLSADTSGIFTYSWIPATGLSCTDCLNPDITVSSTTSYTLVVDYKNECQSFLQILIEVEDCEPEDDNGFTFNNYGAQIVINSGYTLNVYGSIYNDDGGINYLSNPYTNYGRWYNEGIVQFTKNWTNNSIKHVFLDMGSYITVGDVELIGGTQKINGNSPTIFNNLTLLEYGRKIQYVSAGVKGILSLIDSELDLRDNTMYINNDDRAAITRNTGYVVTHTAPSLFGWLERDMNFVLGAASDYDFPVAAYNQSMDLIYRPVNATIFSTDKHLRTRCVYSDPNAIVPNGNNKAANISMINDKFYHQIEETESHNPVATPSNAVLKIFYNEAEDGTFQSISHFDDQQTTYPSSIYPPITVPVWKCATTLSWESAVLPDIYSYVFTAFWDDYTRNEFALSQAGIYIDTDSLGDNGSGYTVSGPYSGGAGYDPGSDTGPTFGIGDDVVIVPDSVPQSGNNDHFIINVGAGEENTGSLINFEINNSMLVEDVTVEIDGSNYDLSGDLYDIVDGSILILRSDPPPFGPECENNFNIELRDGIALTPNSTDGLFQEFSIAGIVDFSYFELNIFDKGGAPVFSETGVNIGTNKWDGLVDVSGTYQVVEGIYKFELIYDSSTVLKGQFIVRN